MTAVRCSDGTFYHGKKGEGIGPMGGRFKAPTPQPLVYMIQWWGVGDQGGGFETVSDHTHRALSVLPALPSSPSSQPRGLLGVPGSV